MKKLFWPLNLLLLAAFAWAVGHYWGYARLLAPWQGVAGGLIAAVVLAQMASYSLRALRIYLAEPRIPKGAWGRCLQLILLNNLFNLLLPARTGEASFPLLLKRWFGVGLTEGTGTLLWLRLLDLNVLAVLALLCLAPALLPQFGAFWPWLALLAAAAPLLAPWLQGRAAAALLGRSGKLPKLLLRLLAGVPAHARQLGLDLLLTWSAWGIKLALLAQVFAALAGLPLKAALLGAIGGDLSTVLPVHTPGGFGTYEAGVMALVAPLAAPTPALLAAAVNLHLLVLGIALAAGALAWLTQPRMPESAP